MAEHKTKVLIIGSGPAGYSAAIYTARACLEPILVQGIQPGGQLTITTDVENYPGYAEVVQGPWMMEQMQKQAENVGTNMKFDTILEVDFSKRPFVCKADSGDVYIADSIIIATGAQAQWLGLESEEKYKGFGVSGCATCDGFFFKNKKVMVVGGGNTAVEDAMYLSALAKEVVLIHRRSDLRAEKLLQERLFKTENISIIWDTILEEVLGEDNPLNVIGAKVKNVKTGKIEQIDLDGVFIAIGHKPNTNIFKNKVELDNEGYIIVEPGTTNTNIEGVFAAGDVQDKIYRQAVTAAGTGCMAALDAEKYLAANKEMLMAS